MEYLGIAGREAKGMVRDSEGKREEERRDKATEGGVGGFAVVA